MKTFYLVIIAFTLLFSSFHSAFSQIDLDCDGRDTSSIYLISSQGYYRIDSVNTNPTNPIYLTDNVIGNIGISINNNLDSVNGSLTMYSCYLQYYYWNGVGWVFTGSNTGNCVNPGGWNNYIYNLADNGSVINRFDGTTNTPILTNVGTPNDFVHDIAVDNQGNFYMFYTNVQQIRVFTSNGIPVDTFPTTGFPAGSQCGLAILGNRIYATECSGTNDLYEGIKTGNTFNFSVNKKYRFSFS